ncbi:olfactory receptor 14A16-like [Mauremys mutica]|uniref:olfactory receptor 14A16-like n=1 Tax=Mauremys mutica TaxID=74926 RepID=UPI001D168296|nr:olfactory receptor 14A16-like [Mauremys mutica]
MSLQVKLQGALGPLRKELEEALALTRKEEKKTTEWQMGMVCRLLQPSVFSALHDKAPQLLCSLEETDCSVSLGTHNPCSESAQCLGQTLELGGFSPMDSLMFWNCRFYPLVILELYLISLLGNFLIITAIALDHPLHTPMYFFLMNLYILDLSSISVTIPKSMANSLMNTRSISYSGCVTQIFLVVMFVSADFAILTVMAYDRYVAICQPLHYETVNRSACVQMAASAWISGILYSALHTGNTFAISFCGGNMVDQFFCEILQLLKLACSDSYHFEVGFLIFSMCLASSCFVFIIVSYVQIFKAVLRIPSKQGQHKAFSTCLPHLFVVSLFLCTSAFAYLKPISSSTSGLDFMVAVLYSVLPPVMNPIIYSMRNRDQGCSE